MKVKTFARYTQLRCQKSKADFQEDRFFFAEARDIPFLTEDFGDKGKHLYIRLSTIVLQYQHLVDHEDFDCFDLLNSNSTGIAIAITAGWDL